MPSASANALFGCGSSTLGSALFGGNIAQCLTWRADERGRDDVTVYQIMALVGLFYCAGIALALGGRDGVAPQLDLGFAAVAAPAALGLIAFISWAIFLQTGWSMVTVPEMSFHVRRDGV